MYEKVNYTHILGNSNSFTKDENEEEKLLKMVNGKDFLDRCEPYGEYKEPDDLKCNSHCHETARKFAECNQNIGWKRVCGFLIEKSKVDKQCKEITLRSHSVVKDSTGKLLEFTLALYPLGKYYFIESSYATGIDITLSQ